MGSIAEKDFAHIGEDSTVTEAAKEMRDKDTTSLIITKKNSSEPIGIVREKYLVSWLAENNDPSTALTRKIMNYPLIYVDEATTIKEGICLMKNRYVRRLPLKKTGKVIGIVTLKRIIGNIPSQGMDLAVRREVKPYCLQKFEDKEKTSKHIDDAHLLNC